MEEWDGALFERDWKSSAYTCDVNLSLKESSTCLSASFE